MMLRIIKGHNFVVNLLKLTFKNRTQELINLNAYAKFGLIPSICSQDIEWKQNSDNNKGP